ncbi:MAG: hypothetical protein GXO35_05020 [Gammaproteobacteria bacterium]|nr:hypothetical protein [Gammaproteobacteria bacterium]
MEAEVVAAIISGIAVVFAAVIAGVFAIKKRNEDKNSQSAQAGGHVIQASGQITQNISINDPTAILSHQTDELLEIVSSIKDYANNILVENEIILSPLFSEKPKRDEVKEGIVKLFTEQRGRANFGEWEGYLTNALMLDKYQNVKDLIIELLLLLKQLHNSLYSYYDNSPYLRKNNVKTMKYYMIAMLENKDVSIEQLKISANAYLEFLRNTVEKIGMISGTLKSQQ